MTDAQLKKLCANWRKEAKFYRGKGFRLNNFSDIEYRRGMALGLDHCAEELSHVIRKAKK